MVLSLWAVAGFAPSVFGAGETPILRLAKPQPELKRSERPLDNAPVAPPKPAAWGTRLPVASGSQTTIPTPSSKALATDPSNEAPLSIPLLQGYDSFGLSVPDHDATGRLRSLFVIGAISRVDDRTVEIRDSFLETYRENGGLDLSIEMPKANLDRFTRVLASKMPVVIRRDEFELKGATMEFNTLTREGGMGGAVEMVIYNGVTVASEEEAPIEKKQKR
ncbi:MAG: hypothetical protein WCK17_05400 [Verrucomicrobiota bacterium]